MFKITILSHISVYSESSAHSPVLVVTIDLGVPLPEEIVFPLQDNDWPTGDREKEGTGELGDTTGAASFATARDALIHTKK